LEGQAVPHRIPRLNAMVLALAEFAAEATDMGELKLAKLLVDAMSEAQHRSFDLAGPTLPTPAPQDPQKPVV
jgi:hypothetical protein